MLKVIGNATAVSALAPSRYLPDTLTHSRSEVWVNCLFFASLSLSLSTALLSVLVKQWLQAYDSSMSGSARDRALVRHLRFMGLTKWKLDEIIGALLIVLHVSVAVFIMGLVVFLWALYQSMAYIVIIISGISFTLYLTSAVMPAIDIECPYRIPLLYRPVRYLVLLLSGLYGRLKTVGKWLWSTIIKKFTLPQLPRNSWVQLCSAIAPVMDALLRSSHLLLEYMQNVVTFVTSPMSPKETERSAVQNKVNTHRYLYYSIAWLHELSSNKSVRRVAAQAIAGELCNQLNFGLGSLTPSCISAICTTSIIRTAADGLFDGEDTPPEIPVEPSLTMGPSYTKSQKDVNAPNQHTLPGRDPQARSCENS